MVCFIHEIRVLKSAIYRDNIEIKDLFYAEFIAIISARRYFIMVFDRERERDIHIHTHRASL